MTQIQQEYAKAIWKIRSVRTGKYVFFYHEYDHDSYDGYGLMAANHFESCKLAWQIAKDET